MPIWNNKNHIGIWGFGKEAQSALRFLKQKAPEAHYKIYSNQADLFHNIHPENVMEEDIKAGTLDLVIKSPGVSLYHPLCKQLHIAGIDLSSATNLWFEENLDEPGKTIIVTGTKGKSTTASLLYHLLTKLEYGCVLAGNIGTNLIEQEKAKDFTIIELSSYQLADLRHTPDLFIVTNLFKEHVPWHETEAQYYHDKLRLKLEHRNLPTIAGNCAKLKEYLADLAHVEWADTNQTIDWSDGFRALHLQENALVALNAIDALTRRGQEATKYLSSFQGLPHRLEKLGHKDGILYVDDSISTIPEATLAALELYKDKQIGLIMGGSDRGQEYDSFAEQLKAYNITEICILPDHEYRLQDTLKANMFNGKISLCESLEQALNILRSNTTLDVILLSPGAPSYAQFKNFEERGDTFKKLSGF